MTLTKREAEQLLDDACRMIGMSGGSMDEEGADYEAAWLRMDRERETLTQQYPDKWVAMGKDGVVAVGDTLDDVVAKSDAQGVRRGSVDIKFMDTNPSPMLL